MKDKLLNTILTEIAEEAAPSRQIDILPGLKKSLDKSNRHFIPRFNQGDTDMIHSIKPGKLLPRAALIGVALVIVLAAFFSSDQGQALAQKLFQFFRVTEEKSFVLPTDQMWTNPATPTPVPPYILPLVPAPVEVNPTPLPTVDSTCSTPASQKTYFCQNQTVEAQAGFDLKEFVYDPKGMKYAKVSYFPETGEARTEFVVTGGYLYLVQGINEYISTDNPWTMVPSDAVKQVSVNGNYAEIVEGTYAYYLGATEAVWDPYGRIRLFWREGNRWFLLEKIGEPYPIEWMTPEELVRLAESLVDQRLLDAVPPVDTENLLSVAAAQELAGYDLLSPSLLPEGYVFKRASYAGEVVRLFYESEKSSGYGSLMISMGPAGLWESGGCSDCPPGTVENVQVGPWQGWYWRGIFHTEQSVEGQPTPAPEWQANANYWTLGWQADRLGIEIVYWTSENGPEMNKENLISIAESLR